jgi:hypothetical protein
MTPTKHYYGFLDAASVTWWVVVDVDDIQAAGVEQSHELRSFLQLLQRDI